MLLSFYRKKGLFVLLVLARSSRSRDLLDFSFLMLQQKKTKSRGKNEAV
jgi:hypothetical protein